MAGRDIASKIPAGQHVKVSAAGDFVHVKSTSGDIRIEIDGKDVDMSEGDKLVERGAGFKEFIAHNDSGADITAIFVVGYGDYSQGKLVGSVTLTKATGGSATADATIGATSNSAVLAANSARREAMITNMDAAAVLRCNIGAAAGAALGQPIGPGQTVTLTTTGAVNIYNPTASSVVVALLEIED